jgi:predicted amidohydrolase YtcJ
MSVTVFTARSVVTLDSAVSQANAVAVQDGRVLHTGMLDQVLADHDGHDITIHNQIA